MKEEILRKLNTIRHIWANYIWEYQFCNSKVKFTKDVKSNYFADILNYFDDSLAVLYSAYHNQEGINTFERTISFLQAIYVHQDLIEESLLIFKCNIVKGDLKQDENYCINRAIRNELVGHPIRKYIVDGTLQLRSSCIFHYNYSEKDKVAYIRYHIENEYHGEVISHSKKEILKRHEKFLIDYLNIILNKAYKILRQFRAKILEIETAKEKVPFEKLVTFVFDSFEKIADQNHLYNSESLIKINKKKEEHPRYKFLINNFYKELDIHLKETKIEITQLLGEELNGFQKSPHYNDFYEEKNHNYNYELSKLITKRELEDLNFFSGLLLHKCPNNHLVAEELTNMKEHFYSKIEYYCSYYFLDSSLTKNNC